MNKLRATSGIMFVATLLLSGCALPPAPPTSTGVVVTRVTLSRKAAPEQTATPLPHLTDEERLRIACRSLANLVAPSSEEVYYWRMNMNFNPYNLACLEVRRKDQLDTPKRFVIGCSQGGTPARRSTIPVDVPIPSLPAAGGPTPTPIAAPVVTPSAGYYLECPLNIRWYLEETRKDPIFANVITQTASVYTYTYFSMSALVVLPTAMPYRGLIAAVVPITNSVSGATTPCTSDFVECQPSLWGVVSPTVSTFRLASVYNGQFIHITPPIKYTLGIQGWWTGVRDRRSAYAEKPEDEVIRAQASFLVDNSGYVSDLGLWQQHNTVTFNRDFAVDSRRRFKFWAGDVKVYIGGVPPEYCASLATCDSFNGSLLEVFIDPGGTGKPDNMG
ncbi:MAG: hypothetical protein RMN52_06760 [Anaerolineae bacterium]|nr:hypothetical protein [Candidatus Roseilinea sp.]MDW8449687.1 hypothetical protein [Anaerolineae bacterium]